jgi:hypothetical protein
LTFALRCMLPEDNKQRFTCRQLKPRCSSERSAFWARLIQSAPHSERATFRARHVQSAPCSERAAFWVHYAAFRLGDSEYAAFLVPRILKMYHIHLNFNMRHGEFYLQKKHKNNQLTEFMGKFGNNYGCFRISDMMSSSNQPVPRNWIKIRLSCSNWSLLLDCRVVRCCRFFFCLSLQSFILDRIQFEKIIIMLTTVPFRNWIKIRFSCHNWSLLLECRTVSKPHMDFDHILIVG